MTAEQKIRVAVIGGGLAGACVANALFNKPQLDVHVYEAAPEFSERGAAIGISAGGMEALNAFLPSALDLVVGRAGGVEKDASRMMFGSGPHAGGFIWDIDGGAQGYIVHRAALLSALIEPLPQDILHVNKRLQSVETTGNRMELTFTDGVKEMFDAVIGADGIFGSVREHVLRDAAPQHAATPGGFWDCRYLVPYEKAKAKLGPQYFEKVHRQYGWIGDGAFIMHDVLDNGETVQCVISGYEKAPPKERSRPLTREILEKQLANWLDGPIASNMIDLVLECDDLKMYSQWEHKTTPTYCNGEICIMGDAAHAMTPWQGSGGTMAMEDAAVLGAVLGDVQSPAEIASALQAYDEVRRPRDQRIVDSSRGSGMYMCGQDEAAGADADGMRALLGNRWTFITQFDITNDIERSVARAKEIRAAKNTQ